MNEVILRSRTEQILGEISIAAGDFDGAVQQLLAARDLFAQTALLGGTKIFLDPHALADCIARLGSAYALTGQRERAFDCLGQAEKICLAAEDVQGLAKHQCHLASLYVNGYSTAVREETVRPSRADVEAATVKLRESLEARKKHGNRYGVAECLQVCVFELVSRVCVCVCACSLDLMICMFYLACLCMCVCVRICFSLFSWGLWCLLVCLSL
jgi:hypothetical protein